MAAAAPAPRRPDGLRRARAGAAARVRGQRRRRQGRGDQARRRAARPAPLPGVVVRQADVRREAPPLPVALLPRRSPGLGGMSVFDRSWYGRVLVERIEGFATDEQWSRAYEEIVSFERTLVLEGVILVKFWLHISDDEQLRRFEDRQSDPLRQWKITEEDWRNRKKQPGLRRRRRGDVRAHRPPPRAVGPRRRPSRSATPGCAVLETLNERVEQGMRALGHAGAVDRRARPEADAGSGWRRRRRRAVDCADARRRPPLLRTAREPRRRGRPGSRAAGRTRSSSTSTPAASTSPTC